MIPDDPGISEHPRRAPVYNWPALIAIAAIVVLLAWLFVRAFTTEAQAQGVACAQHDELLASLSTKFHEKVVVRARWTDGSLVEVTASQSGTWTMLVTGERGMSCVMGAGKDWTAKPWPDHEA